MASDFTLRDPRVEPIESDPASSNAYLHRAARVAVLLAIPAFTHAGGRPRFRELGGSGVRIESSLPAEASPEKNLTGPTAVPKGMSSPAALGRAGNRPVPHAGLLGNVSSLYEAAGGREGLLRLAAAWHARVMADEVVSHAFSHGFHPQHTERLAAYWAEALGGPNLYSEAYGSETSVVRMHGGNGPHEEMDRRAIACFDQALQDAGLTAEPLRGALHDYFAWATTTSMARYPGSSDEVPSGSSIPRWSWDGLQP